MKYRYTVLFGITFGVIGALLWGTVFSNTLGPAGIGVGIALGAAFACCGCLAGRSVDKNNNSKDE